MSALVKKLKNHPFATAYFSGLLAIFASKGLSIIPGYSVDDYAISYFGVSPASNLDKGRFTNSGLELFLNAVGLNSYEASVPSAFILMFIMPLSILLGIKYVLGGFGNLFYTSAGISLILAHPYFTEYLTFRQTIPGLLLLFILMAAFFILLNQSSSNTKFTNIRNGILSVFLVVLMTGLFQTALIVIVIFVFAKIIFTIVQVKTLRNVKFDLLITFLSTVVSFVMFKLSLTVAGKAPEERTALIGFTDLKSRMPDVFTQVVRMWVGEEPVLSAFSKWLVIAVLILLLCGLFFISLKAFFLEGMFLVVAYPIACILPIVAGVWWPVPRVFFAVGFVLGLFVVMSGAIINQRFGNAISLIPIITILAFALSSNEILLDQQRVNRWDQWAASKIISDVSSSSQEGGSQIIIVGPQWAHPAQLGTIQGDMNTSALTIGYSIGSLFSESTGVVWNVIVEPSNPKCDNASPWPTPDSYVYTPEAVYVCMADRR